jgi:hypothetical protein
MEEEEEEEEEEECVRCVWDYSLFDVVCDDVFESLNPLFRFCFVFSDSTSKIKV